MTEPKPRSRTAWPGPMSRAGVEPGHTHELPRALRTRYRLLMVAVVALLLAVGTLTFFVYQQQLYIEGRGEYRDRESARVEEQSRERIRQAICDLLDQLPEGGLLDRPRAKYGCGPGIPLDQLTDDERARIQGSRSPAPSAAPSAPSSPPSSSRPRGNTFRPPPESPPEPSAAPEPTTSPAPDPLVDLGPITDLACDSVGICID